MDRVTNLIAATAAVLIVAVVVVNADGLHRVRRWLCDEHCQATVMCEQFLREDLVAPRTARFPTRNARPENVQVLADGAFRVVGHVDADNVFGAHVRGRYVCRLHRVHEMWYVDWIENDQDAQMRAGARQLLAPREVWFWYEWRYWQW
jgi:hypothetical protein